MSDSNESNNPIAWLPLPPTTLSQELGQFWQNGGRELNSLASKGCLSTATMSVRDENDGLWKTNITTDQNRCVASACEEQLDGAQQNYLWKLELVLDPPVAVEQLRSLVRRFPGAEFHLPGMIIRDSQCFDYREGHAVEMAILVSIE